MKTPITETIVLAANQEWRYPLAVSARYMHVRSCTVASFLAAFDDDPLQTFYAGATYPSREAFSYVRFKDSSGSGCTIEVVFSDSLAADVSFDSSILSTVSSTLTALEALVTLGNVDLAALETLLEVPDVPVAVPEATIPQTGVSQTQLVTAAAVNRKIEIQADYDNTGSVYIGFATGVTKTNCAICLVPGQSFPFDGNLNIWASSENGTELARGYYVAIS